MVRDKESFHIQCEGNAEGFLDKLTGCTLTNTMTPQEWARLEELGNMKSTVRAKTPGLEDEKSTLEERLVKDPIRLLAPFDICCDWFLDTRAGGSRFKTWAGRQGVFTIASAMKSAIAAAAFQKHRCENWFSYSVAECGLPFNFDSDLGGQGGALDIGFSFDPLAGNAATRIEPSARPFLELLAFVGLQRFRPRAIEKENRFLYCAWNRPLPIAIAAPAANGMLPIPDAPLYEFRLLYRTKYLKSFLPAIPFTGGSDE